MDKKKHVKKKGKKLYMCSNCGYMEENDQPKFVCLACMKEAYHSEIVYASDKIRKEYEEYFKGLT